VTSGNDYVLQIKGNQPTLQARIQAAHAAQPTPPGDDHHRHQERRSGRVNTWQTSVYPCHDPALQADWAGLARFVVVVKTVAYQGKTTEHRHCYLTSLATLPAAALAAGIRGHWGIENKLHRTRDVHFRQDTNGIRNPVAAANMAFFNTLALNHLLETVDASPSFAQISFAQNMKEYLMNLKTKSMNLSN